MTEITVKFDLTFSRRFIVSACAAAMMLCAVPELDSESVTLSTYYPAPSGVYTNMITTGNTYLARDGGLASMVGLGTAAPQSKLHLAKGELGIGQRNDATPYMKLGMDTGWVQYVANNAYFDEVATNYKYVNTAGYGGLATRMNQVSGTIGFDTASGGVNPITWVNRMSIANNGTTTVTGSLRAGSAVVYTGANCTLTVYGLGVQNCPAGQYVTFTQGFMTKYTTSVGSTDPGGTMLCCPCPVGGCPSL